MTPFPLPFPETLRISRSNLTSLFRRLTVTQTDSPELQFEIAVPEGWTPIPESPWRGSLASRFTPLSSLGDSRAGIDIAATRPGRDVNPSDWLDIALNEAGEQIRECHESPSAGGWTSDVLTTSGGHCRRSLSSAAGGIVWIVSAWADLASYARLADTLYVCLNSFRPLQPSPPIPFEAATPSGMSFRYPRGWTLTALDSGARLTNSHEGIPAGAITVEHDTGTSAARLLDCYLESLDLDGLSLLPAEPVPVAPTPGLSIDSAVCVATQASRDGCELEIMAMAVAAGQRAAITGLVSPARSSAPEWWAINKRAWEIVAGTLRLNPEGGGN